MTASTAPASIGRRLVVLTGLSGGGKTVVLRALEDHEFYCVDNLPAQLLPQLVSSVDPSGLDGQHHPIAVGVDVRNRSKDLERIPGLISSLLSQDVEVQLIFLDCRDDVLIKRYSETRRRHPLAAPSRSLADAIADERRLLRPLMAIADRIIDTSDLNIHQLRRLVATDYAPRREGLILMFESFAFKRGLPQDTDFAFDARCLPNPHWEPALRPLSGKDVPVRDYLDQQPLVQAYFTDIIHWLDTWLPHFEHEGRSYVTISIGCTGGRHRSVYLVEKLAAHYRQRRDNVVSFHREIE